MNLILLGAPGSGKGTQAFKLSEKYKIPHISTGDIFREAIKKEDALSLRVKGIVEGGGLVPDEIVLEIVLRELRQESNVAGFVLDGFPRTLPQAESLDKNYREPLKVLYIKLEEKEVVRRLSGRRICKQCGKGYHLLFNPSREERVCDSCGGELYQRKDDEEATIKNRLLVYEKHIGQVLSFYEKKENLSIIEGNKAIEEIFFRLCKVIDE
ncbi:adenylate kinase [bacterium]|nr:adenylate kinase [bacterium]